MISQKEIRRKFQQIKLIYVPFLLLSAGFVIIYTFLHWVLILKLQLFQLDERIIDFWLPAILPWVPVLLILRRRIRLLDLKPKGINDKPFLIHLMAALAFIIPAIIAQSFIRTASGKLSHVYSPDQINVSQLTKYYQFDEFYLNKNFASIYWDVEVTGKYNSEMVFHAYIALPLMTSAADTTKKYITTWYGIEYNDQISNRMSKGDKELHYRSFQVRINQKFEDANLYQLYYFDRMGSNDMHKALVKAVKSTNNYNHTINPIILKPVDEPFELRTGSKFLWLICSFIIFSIIWLLIIVYPKLNRKELNKFLSEENKVSRREIKFRTILSYIIPRKEYFATHLIIELNLIVFLIMAVCGLGFISFNGNDLLKWGANFGPLIESGQYWRLFTSTYLHGGVMHLLMNMYGLFFIGLFLQPILGSRRFLIIYTASGILASIVSVWWHNATVSIGASGAIFGMYGVFLALLMTRLFPKAFQMSFLISMVVFISYNLLIGLSGNIDNAAHIGGLLSGMAIGFIYYPILKGKKKNIIKPTRKKRVQGSPEVSDPIKEN